jgi:hypothetical protein
MSTDLPRELLSVAKLLERDEPRVLVAVGAGVSIGATGVSRASWLGLLEHGVEHLVETEVFTRTQGERLRTTLGTAFSPFDLSAALRHAELVEQNLKTPDDAAFARWLQSAFEGFAVSEGRTETLDALRDLEQAGALLLTTNYDSLLSKATGLPPVTWEEHAEFLQVITRQKRGILHVHGHWQRPSSVVLGKSSYDRNAADRDFQDLFKLLWLERSWLYVGFGNGLDDPNLGSLLEWSKRWNKDPLSDYFLAKEDQAIALTNRSGKSSRLVCVGYENHPDLPGVLRALSPAVRCRPFIPLDADFAIFRSQAASPLQNPFASRREYLEGAVPALDIDTEVRARLEKHRWVFVFGLASVGKTTLAVRMALAPDQRDHPTFYLDLASVDADGAEDEAGGALRRISRPGSLLILDNVHHQPELARQLWDQWRQRPGGSRLLLVATRMQRAVVTAPMEDLAFFEYHTTNPAIELRPTASDLGSIVAYLHARVDRPRPVARLVPPPATLQRWHYDYGSAVSAFCIAALNRLAAFERGRWDLPLEAASLWVQQMWLEPLDAENRANVLCLAAFGRQELELEVLNEALPFPGHTDRLLRVGLVAQHDRGQFGQYHRFRLREPGWGALLLAAQAPAVDEEKLLFETAARHPTAALALSARLYRERALERQERLWAYLALNPAGLLELLPENPFSFAPNLAKAARDGQQPALSIRFWAAIEHDPDKLAERQRETPLQFLASFLDTARRQQRSTTALWEAIERDADRVAERAWETPLHFVASFLDTAKRHQRDTTKLWEAIERDADKLAERAWESPLGDLASFLDAAERHHRDTTPLWETIEREPNRFAERAWETPLHFVASFLDSAKRHHRDTAPLWEAMERNADKLAERALETPLGEVASFLETAKRHQRDPTPLWDALERNLDRLVERALEARLDTLGSFLDTAQRHGRNTTTLWRALERGPDKLVERAWATPLDGVASYLSIAKRHGHDTTALWMALEKEPEKLADRARETPLDSLASFLDMAKLHGRDTRPLWEALESAPEKLVERVWETRLDSLASFLDAAKRHGRDPAALWCLLEDAPVRLAERAWETPLDSLSSFLDAAQRHGRDTAPLWSALEREPGRLAERAWETPLDNVVSFFDVAKRHQRDMGGLWEAIERVPETFAERAWETPLGGVALFLETAKQHGRDPAPLIQTLEARPEKLSALALQSPINTLAGFCHYAPDSLVKIALADFQTTHWNRVARTEPLLGATWVAGRCGNIGREDLESALIETLLSRANPQDFPPQSMALANVAWLLEQPAAVSSPFLASFLDALCTRRWLGGQFTFANSGAVAKGLRMLALFQPAAIRHRFQNPSLGIRVRAELSRFTRVAPQEQSRIIQLLGSAALFGLTAKKTWFATVPLATVARLPVDTLGHRAEAENVEDWQFQLWLGLRVVREVTSETLDIPVDAILRTLDLWRCNLTETSTSPRSAAHFVNESMVGWLERCSVERFLSPSMRRTVDM